jgi:membrane protein DedA with SNARE-associated domain
VAELAIIGALVAAIAGYLVGRWDGLRAGMQIMRDEFDEYRAIKGMQQ